VVARFNDVRQGETCGDRSAAPALETTRWKLTHLGDAAVVLAGAQQEPHLILDPETGRASGSGGCNRLTGSYEVKGVSLTFGAIAGTMMACPAGMDTEQAFYKALGAVRTWKIDGQRLELFDQTGGMVARFEAR
jgi:heat shock protein HslJ